MSKKGKVKAAEGIFYYADHNGQRRGITTLREALNKEAECCGIDCCNNRIKMAVNDDDGISTYPAYFEFVKVGSDYKLKITITTPSGVTVKTADLS